MNGINFTGIKNAGFMSAQVIHPELMSIIDRNYLVAQLTDDYNGNDLTEFNEVVKKCQPDLGECTFPFNKNFINIFTSKFRKIDSVPELYVNFKKVPMTSRTMPLFSYVARLTRRLAKVKPEKLEINHCFKFGPDGDRFIYGDIGISDIVRDSDKLEQALNSIYSPNAVKIGAKRINQDIQEQMEDYLA